MKKIFKKKISNKILFSLTLLLIIFISLIFFFLYKYTSKQPEYISPVIAITEAKIENRESTKSTEIKIIPTIENKKDIPLTVAGTIANQLKVPILFYHYVGNNPNPQDLQRDVLSISPDKFEEQMKYLKENGYKAISLDTLYAALKKQVTLPDKSIVITFDDGYIDFYYNAYHVLQNYGLSATVFIPTGLVGQPAYLTWSQIKEMQSSGVINFGAHTIHHYNLPSISSDSILTELQESKKMLEDQLGIPINFLAYPNGATNNTVIGLVQKTGYAGAVGTWPNNIQSEGTTYNMPRFRISGSISIDNFANIVR